MTSAGYGTIPPAPPPPPAPPGPEDPQRRSGLVVAVVAGVVAVVCLAALTLLAIRVVGSDPAPVHPTELALPSPTGPPTHAPAPTAPPRPLGTVRPTSVQCAGGTTTLRDAHGPRLTGGGLSAPSLIGHGFHYSALTGMSFGFASDAVATVRTVTRGWVAPILVGTLARANGFRSPEQAARVVLTCLANDPRSYAGAYALDEVAAGPTVVDGHAGFALTENIRVRIPGLNVRGDTVEVVVVDTGKPRSFGLLLVATPLGDAPLAAVRRQVVAQLRVE